MISYKKLWNILSEKEMTKEQLKNAAGLASGTMTRISKGEPVNLKTINAICECWHCQPGDILTWIPDRLIEEYNIKIENY